MPNIPIMGPLLRHVPFLWYVAAWKICPCPAFNIFRAMWFINVKLCILKKFFKRCWNIFTQRWNWKRVGFYCHLERQILWEPNQVRVLPKWELKRVYWNLIRVKDFTLKFRAHAGDLMVMMMMAKIMVLSRRLLLSMVSDINKSKKCVNKKQGNQ